MTKLLHFLGDGCSRERNQQGKGLVGSRGALRPGWVKGRLRGATRPSERAHSQPVAATWACGPSDFAHLGKQSGATTRPLEGNWGCLFRALAHTHLSPSSEPFGVMVANGGRLEGGFL